MSSTEQTPNAIPMAKMSWFERGGAAFPIPHSGASGQPEAEHGMTLRDYFAGEALPSILSQAQALEGSSLANLADVIAASSYFIADAMIAAREKVVTPPGQGTI